MFTLEELKYLEHVLKKTTSYTIAQGEQIQTPSVSHKKVMSKVQRLILRLTI